MKRTRLAFFGFAILATACSEPVAPLSHVSQEFTAPIPQSHAGRIHEYDVLHYRVELSVDPESPSYEGRVAIRFVPQHADFRTLRLDCGDNELLEAKFGDRNLALSREGERLRLGFPESLARDEQAEVTISFRGVPSRGIHFRGPDAMDPQRPYQAFTQGECEEMRYVFPCYDFPDDKATSELLVSVPEKFKTIAAGALLGSAPGTKAGWRQDRWRMDTPHSSYLFTLVVGEFAEVREEWNGIPVQYFSEAGDEEKLKIAFGKTPKALQFFSDYIGVSYPYPKYAQVCVRDFQFGGMENISATTQTRLTLHEASSEPLANSDGLMAHELAHQWWGDLLTCADWSQIWLSESFATYFEALFRESEKGRDEFRLAMQGTHQAAIEGEKKESRPIVYDRYIDPLDLFFGGHVYPGGASRLHLLRFWLGEERFRAGISLYAKRHREKTVTTEDFRIAMEDASGEKLEEFFRQWIYGSGFPEFRVRWEWDERDSCMLVRVTQMQRGEAFILPVELAFVVSEQPAELVTRRLWIREREQTFVLPFRAKPLLSRFDAGGWIPKALDEEKDLEEFLYQLRRDEEAVGRLEAAKALGTKLRLQGALALEPGPRQRLVEILQERFAGESQPQVREEILAALVEENTPAVRDFFLSKISEPEARARRKILWALGHFSQDARVVEALRKHFAAEKNAYVAAEIPAALARKKNAKAGEFLLEAIEKDSDGDVVRAAAIAALAELRHPQAPVQALRFARQGKSEAARVAGLRALARTGKESQEARETFLAALDDGNSRIRSVAAELLGESGDLGAVAALSARHRKEPFSPVRRAIEKAIAKLGTSK